MVSVNASVPPLSAISRREVAFHTQNAGCMLSSCRQWLFHLHQCHHCPQPLGSLARGRHGGLPGILQVYPYVCCIQVVFNIYIYKYIYQKPIIYFYIVCILYSWKQCLSIVLFWYILFLSGAVYSFKQKNRWHKNCCCSCRGMSSQLSRALPLFPLPPGCVTLFILFPHGKNRRCPCTEDQYQVTQACGTWQTACFLALRFFFSFWTLPSLV